MQLTQAMSGLETAVETQLRVAGPEATELGAQLLSALQPAIRQTFFDVLCMAATEVSSQLPNHRVEVKIVDGDPELVVSSETVESTPPPGPEDDEARITLRLPGYLKEMIAEAASSTGDSVNTFVVDALKCQARSAKVAGRTRMRTTIDL
jgi:hypothetical protein